MPVNLQNYGETHTNTLKVREITNDEGIGSNPDGILIHTNDNKIDIITDLSLNIGVTTGNVNIDSTVNLVNDTDEITLDNNTFVNKNNLVLDTKSNSGAIYLNKTDFSTNTTGDWRLRIDGSNDLIIENYNGSWITKMKLESG